MEIILLTILWVPLLVFLFKIWRLKPKKKEALEIYGLALVLLGMFITITTYIAPNYNKEEAAANERLSDAIEQNSELLTDIKKIITER